MTPAKNDVIAYQIFAAILVAALAFVGMKYGGFYFRSQYAMNAIAHGDRPPGPEAAHDAALQLAKGYKDTAAFDSMKQNLTSGEMAAGFVEQNAAEKYAPHAAVAGLVIGFFASYQAARSHARKKAAQGSISRTTQRFQGGR
jgi:hypothetical protein